MEATALVAVEEYLRTSYDPDMDYVDGVLEERNLELRTRTSSRQYRVPDVVIIEGKRPKKGILDRAPLAAIEILSPEDRLSRVQQRMDDYLSIGTPFVWLIDATARRAWRYTADLITEVKDDMLRVDTPSFVLPLDELFSNIDRMTE